MTFCVCFDIDGTLFDTRELVRQSYSDVGVVMPNSAWGLPWQDWLDSETLHDSKTERYITRLDETPPPILSAAETLNILIGEGLCDIAFATGASSEAATVLLLQLDLNMSVYAHTTNASSDRKIEFLSSLRIVHEDNVVYVDDDELAGMRIARAAGVTFVHYKDQAPLLLMEEIWTA